MSASPDFDSESATALQQQLAGLATVVREYAAKRNLSDAKLCKRLSELGSTKTWKRIREGRFGELDLERQLHNLRLAVARIENEEATGAAIEEDFSDFKHIEAARLAVKDAVSEIGNNRLVLIQGPAGSGKTTVRRLIAQIYPNVIQAEADITWRSQRAMFDDLIRAINPIERTRTETFLPYPLEAKRQKVLDLLKVRRRILDIDEAHHMSPDGLNFLKTVINQTPTVIVLYAYKALMTKLEREAYDECRQLWQNRLCARLNFGGPPREEVAKFLEWRGVKFVNKQDADAAARSLAAEAPKFGHWNFVNLVSRAARREMAGEPLDLAQFTAAQTRVIQTR